MLFLSPRERDTHVTLRDCRSFSQYIYKKRDTYVTLRDIWVTGPTVTLSYLAMSSGPNSFKIELSVVRNPRKHPSSPTLDPPDPHPRERDRA